MIYLIHIPSSDKCQNINVATGRRGKAILGTWIVALVLQIGISVSFPIAKSPPQ